MKIIGLTGGIGSGKSAAAQCFRDAGIPVIDADSTGHRLLETDPAIRQAVIEIFDDGILTPEGAISREKLAARTFGDAAARQRLNALLHPAIIVEVGKRCAAYHVEGHDVLIVEAALIGESGQRDAWLTGLILVLASESVRIERLINYRNFSREEAIRRIAAQTPPEDKRAIADWVIENDGDLETLQARVQQVAAEIHRRK
jgi:dephospho-CoA kinase